MVHALEQGEWVKDMLNDLNRNNDIPLPNECGNGLVTAGRYALDRQASERESMGGLLQHPPHVA